MIRKIPPHVLEDLTLRICNYDKIFIRTWFIPIAKPQRCINLWTKNALERFEMHYSSSETVFVDRFHATLG